MMRWTIIVVLAVLSAVEITHSLAQNTVVPTRLPGDISNAAASTAFVNQAIPGLPIADPRAFVTGLTCSGSVDASAGIASAISAGFFRVRLPAGCFYQPPTNTGNEIIPAGIEIIGDNPDPNNGNISLIRTANRATSTDGLFLGPRSKVNNVAIQSYFCDQQTSPQGTAHLCPLYYGSNIGAQNEGLTNWPYQQFFLISGTTSTQPGATSTDTPLVGITQSNAGDGLFVATTGGGVGVRLQTSSSTVDEGLLVQNATASPSTEHYGIQCAEAGTFSGTPTGGCLKLLRQNGSIYPLFYLSDVGTTTYNTSLMDWVLSYASGGNLLSIFQGTTAFSGNFWNINAGNSGGTFTGNFLSFANGANSYTVGPTGEVAYTGTAWSTFTPSPSCGNATFTTNGARFKTHGKTTFVEMDLTISGIGTTCNGTNNISFSTPNTVQASGSAAAKKVSGSGATVTCVFSGGSTSGACSLYDGTNTWAVSDRIIISGTYENQ